MNTFGIIGGTGLYNLDYVENIVNIKVATIYGDVRMFRGVIKSTNRDVYFMARHGSTHSIPPHLINYRANIAALKLVGVNCILATNAVGSLRREMPPGALVVLDQFLDFTKNRQFTFIDGDKYPVTHLDYTEPYCELLRDLVIEEAVKANLKPVRNGTYVCTEGPRFETPAEIRMHAILGGDLVGMTSVPEVVLAREVGICYSTVALVTNFAAGISPDYLTHEEVLEVMNEHRNKINILFKNCIENAGEKNEWAECRCRESGNILKIEGEISEI